MKLLLKRCHICHDWFSPLRSHCPCCGASEVSPGVHVAVVSQRLLPIASGLNRYYFNRNALSIAQELAK
jgi:predicted amidophosphoribosyltransferase